MDEHGAAAPGHARARVVVDLDDEVVERVLAREPVGLGAGRQLDRPIVMTVTGVLAPAVVAPMRRTGNSVAGRGCRSARHHNRVSRKVPRGVAPSPSRLLALMPARPSATGNASGPACSTPRAGCAGLRRTASRRNEVSRFARGTIQNPRIQAKHQFTLALLALNALLREYSCSGAFE